MVGHNTIEGKAAPFLKRVEDFNEQLESLRGSYMQSCKAVRDQVKEVYVEAKENGVAPRPLKGLVKHRQLTRKQEKIVASMRDDDDVAVFQQLIDTLGPLGAAAARRRGFGDLVKDTIQEGDRMAKGKADGDVNKVGRGSVDLRPAG
jgi:hypothetical protein